MIKNIIFDIGNILLRYDPLPYLNSHYDHGAELYALISQSKEWLMLDQGTLTNEEAIVLFTKQNPALKDEIIHYMTHWSELLTPLEEHVNVFKQVKKNYHVYLLSNFHLEAFQMMRQKYPFLQDVDGQVISADVHQLKPDPAIYQTLFTRYHLRPEECLFIDDSKANIDTAKKLGMKTLHIQANDPLEDHLKVLLK